MKKLVLLTVFFGSLSASAMQLEQLIGYSPSRKGISIQVVTGGCTSKSDFYVERGQGPSGISTLAFYRLERDACLAYFPYGLKLDFSYEELGIGPEEQFQILNPLGASRRALVDGRYNELRQTGETKCHGAQAK